MQKRYLIIFSLLVVSVLFIAGCQEAVGGPTSTRSTRAREDQGMRYNLISSDNRDTTAVTLSSNLNGNCDPPIGTFAYGLLNGEPNTCLRILGCIHINSQATSNRDNLIRLGRENQPLLAVAVYGKDVTKCLAPDVVIIPSNRQLIDTGLSGF